MSRLRERINFGKVYLFNPSGRIWQEETLPEITYSKEEWILTGEALEQTIDILTQKHPKQSVFTTWCFHPHHMIVFCDENGIIIGHVKICFECSNYKVYPPSAIQSNSIVYFRAIIDSLDIYVGESYWDFFKDKPLEELLFDPHVVKIKGKL